MCSHRSIDLFGATDDALVDELQRRGLLIHAWSAADFEFIVDDDDDDDLAHLSGEQLEQLQQLAFMQCRRSLDEIAVERGNEHLGNWWALNKHSILAQFSAGSAAPSNLADH